jgi:hypothetical protein
MKGASMPSSQNRRRIEIPADLFSQLAQRAGDEQTTVAALATRLLVEGMATSSLHQELRLQRGVLEDVQQQLAQVHERIDQLHVVAPRRDADAVSIPLALQPSLIEGARQQLLADLRREQRSREGQQDGGVS